MQLLSTVALCTLLVAGIRSESEPQLTSSLYKDGQQHNYVQQFHHGQPHGSEVTSNSGGVNHLVPNSQIQDQSGLQDQVGHSTIGHGGQVGHGGQGPTPISPVNPIGPIGPLPGQLGPVVQVPYFGQKSEIPLHPGARAIGVPVPTPYYPYLGKTYASPVYGQYQQVPHQGVYQQVYPYHVSPYSASPYSAGPYSSSPYAATPYSALPAPVYPGYQGYSQQPYYQQYVQGVPSFYHQQSNEVQSVNKQQ